MEVGWRAPTAAWESAASSTSIRELRKRGLDLSPAAGWRCLVSGTRVVLAQPLRSPRFGSGARTACGWVLGAAVPCCQHPRAVPGTLQLGTPLHRPMGPPRLRPLCVSLQLQPPCPCLKHLGTQQHVQACPRRRARSAGARQAARWWGRLPSQPLRARAAPQCPQLPSRCCLPLPRPRRAEGWSCQPQFLPRGTVHTRR